MYHFIRSCCFHTVNLESLRSCSNGWKLEVLKGLKEGIDLGFVKPLKKNIFSYKETEDALSNSKLNMYAEKTLINIGKVDRYIQDFKSSIFLKSGHSVLITGTAGPSSALWLALTEWVMKRGHRRIILLLDNNHLSNYVAHRLRSFRRLYGADLIVSSICEPNTIGGVTMFLKETMQLHHLTSIFCVAKDESSSFIRNLDEASRTMLPHLQHFVCISEKDSAVCESRGARGLPACSLRVDNSLQEFSQIFSFLDALLMENLSGARFFNISQNTKVLEVHNVTDVELVLPQSLSVLQSLGCEVSERPVWRELVSRSPGLKDHIVRHSLLPVFVVGLYPGLGSLPSRLMHPAYCCSPPPGSLKPDDYTDMLLEGILNIQRKGPYNLLCDIWGSNIALRLGSLLDSQGHEVELFMLGGSPAAAQHGVRSLCSRLKAELGVCILTQTLNLPHKAVSQLAQYQSWEQQLQLGLQMAAVSAKSHCVVAAALSSLHNQLTGLLSTPAPQLFRGRVTVISCSPLSPNDLDSLLQFCQETPKVIVTEDESHSALMENFETISIINDNIGFDWNL